MRAKFGITFSHPHLQYLGLDIDESLKKAFQFNFLHLRLCVYWDRIEKKPRQYDFRELTSMLDQCEKAGQKVILTVGVKAPRSPEFYWPKFIEKRDCNNSKTQGLILRLVSQTVKELKGFRCISHWQVENEPLDPSGPENQKIPYGFLKKEV